MASQPTSSARPDRLQAFGKIAVGMAEALGHRLNAMSSIISDYMSKCNAPYRVDVSGIPEQLGGLGIQLSRLGHWTDEVGTDFYNSDKADNAQNPDRVNSMSDAQILGALGKHWKDPTLGVDAKTAGTPVDWSKHPHMGQELLQGLQPHSQVPGDISNGLDVRSAAAILPDIAKAIDKITGTKYLAADASVTLSESLFGAASVAATVASSWEQYKGLPVGDRVSDTMLRGAGAAGSVEVGFLVTMLTSETGPFAPVLGFAATGLTNIISNSLFNAILPKPDLNDPRDMQNLNSQIDGQIENGQIDPPGTASQSQGINQAAFNQAQARESNNPQLENNLQGDVNAMQSQYQQNHRGPEGGPGPPPQDGTSFPGPNWQPGDASSAGGPPGQFDVPPPAAPNPNVPPGSYDDLAPNGVRVPSPPGTDPPSNPYVTHPAPSGS